MMLIPLQPETEEVTETESEHVVVYTKKRDRARLVEVGSESG